jgi:hypothetical protein
VHLSDELGRGGTRADLFVVGGSAMALAYSLRRTTRDVDAIFVPKAAVYEAARTVARELSLPDDWLNDAVKAYAHGDDPARRVVFQTPSLTVSVASPHYLLAMKLLAARVDQDTDDIVDLYRLCGFTTAEEGMDLLETAYPGRPVEARTQFLLEELFGPARHRPTLEDDDVMAGEGLTAPGPPPDRC